MSGPLPDAISVARASLAPAYGTASNVTWMFGWLALNVLDDLLLDVDLLRRVAAAEAAVPADLGLAGRGRRPADRDRGVRRGAMRRRTRRPPSQAAADGAAAAAPDDGAAVGVLPPHAPATSASTAMAAMARMARICSSSRTRAADRRRTLGVSADRRGRGAHGAGIDVVGSGAGADDDPLHVVARPVAPDERARELDRPPRAVVGEAFDAQRRLVGSTPSSWASRGGMAIGSSDSRARTTRVS